MKKTGSSIYIEGGGSAIERGFARTVLSNFKIFALTAALFSIFAQCAVCNASDDSRYIVRSDPFADKAQAMKLSQELSDKGYHPVIETEAVSGGEYYFLQMGAFYNVNIALRLVVILKDMGYAFLCVDSSGAKVQAPAGGGKGDAALVSPERTAKLFPYGDGSPALDQWSMIEPAPANRQVLTGGEFKPTRAKPKMFKEDSVKNVPEPSSVGRKLQDLAWELRGKGFDVAFDKETNIEPSGVLAGIFNSREEADKFDEELKSYGYDTMIREFEGADGTQYNVYAEVDALPPSMVTTLDKGIAPPDGAAGADLLNLKKPKKSIFQKDDR